MHFFEEKIQFLFFTKHMLIAFFRVPFKIMQKILQKDEIFDKHHVNNLDFKLP